MGDRTVGIIVNPGAGKDSSRLTSPGSATSDVSKIDTVRRVTVAAVECGAARILWAADAQRLAGRAIERLGLSPRVEVAPLTTHVSGTREDTVVGAGLLRDVGADVVVVLGGDGTCRDAAVGWPGLPLVAISTGTNNVFPSLLDGTSAGTAAGLIAAGTVPADRVTRRAKQLSVRTAGGAEPTHDVALVEVTLVGREAEDPADVRSLSSPEPIREIVAAIADPGATGASGVAGRIRPVDRNTAGGLHVVFDHRPDETAGTRVRVPFVPGRFDTVEVLATHAVADGQPVQLRGPGVLALDGERTLSLDESTTAVVWIERRGPRVIDVAATLHLGALAGAFDERPG